MAISDTSNARRWLTTAEVVSLLGVGEDKVYAWIRSGELRAINVAKTPNGRPTYKISSEAVEAFEKQRLVVPVATAAPPTRTRRRASNVRNYFPN